MSYSNTPITLTSVQNQANRFNYFHLGMADLSGGLIQINQINGVGLVTRGFVWQLGEIWADTQALAPITTTWDDSDSPIVTVWENSESFGNEVPD